MNNPTVHQPDLDHVDLSSCPVLYVTTKNISLGLMILFFLLGILSFESAQVQAAQVSRQQMLSSPEKIPAWLAENKLRFEQIPNPHWNTQDCKTCHRQTPRGTQLYLRGRNVDGLCEYCHTGKYDHSYIHPSNIPVDTKMRKRLSKAFTDNLDAKKRVTCTTCHDIKAQCLANRSNERQINPLFLRNGPYRGRTEICYQCHDNSGYQRRNAHDQIGEDGKVKEYTCLICHDKTKGLARANGIHEVGFNVKQDLARMCVSCHVVKPHPSGNFSFTTKGVPNHFVVPPENIKSKIQQSERERKVNIPLDPTTGKVFCATCHNPHEKGVIKNQAAAKGADENKRLRTQNICTNCHDK